MLHIDPHTGQVTGTSAGHVLLLCAHRDGSHDVRELPGGPLLGLAPDTHYPEETFTLDEDSAPVMVTDDVVEGPGLALLPRRFSCSCCSAAAMASSSPSDGVRVLCRRNLSGRSSWSSGTAVDETAGAYATGGPAKPQACEGALRQATAPTVSACEPGKESEESCRSASKNFAGWRERVGHWSPSRSRG